MDVSSSVDEPDARRLRASLLRSASALVKDPEEASALVVLALEAAREAEAHGAPAGQSDIFRLLRQAYHSIERSRPRRRMRDAAAPVLAAPQAPSGTS